GPRCNLPARRFRMAGSRMLDVRRDERRPRRAGRTLRLDVQPQLRRPPGQGRAHPSDEPGDGGGGRDRWQAHGCPPAYLEAVMEPFRRLDAVAAPIGVPNVDTDQIIPARFLWRKRRDGFGLLLFHDWRFTDSGAPQPDFVLNRVAYQDARIVVADRNFGCGSSREHAVWALYDYGIRAVVAVSFGDIFFNNSFQNGLLPVVLPAERVATLRALLEQSPGSHVAVDLRAQTVAGPDGAIDRFDIDPFRKECLLAGADDISFTLGHRERIAE